MKKFKLKAIIIALFIAFSFAVCFFISHPAADPVLDAQSSDFLTPFLEKHKINIANAVITGKNEVFSATARNELADKSIFAENLFGGTAALSSNGKEYTFGSDKLTLSGTKFSYSAKSLPHKSELYNITLDSAGKKAETIAQICGFDLSGCIITATGENDAFTAFITRSLNGLPVFNDVITMKMSSEGLSSIEGLWFSVSPEKKRAAKSVPAALIQFINNPECPNNGAEISGIELGYVLLDPTQDETPLKPVWRISLSDGKTFYADA